MKATNAYRAKRAVTDALTAMVAAAPDTSPLYGLQVSYDYPARDLQRRCLYGGGARITQSEDAHDGYQALRGEQVTLGWYLRVVGPGAETRAIDAEVESIADTLATWLAENPRLDGAITFAEITSGDADYYPIDEERVSVLGLQLICWSYLS